MIVEDLISELKPQDEDLYLCFRYRGRRVDGSFISTDWALEKWRKLKIDDVTFMPNSSFIIYVDLAELPAPKKEEEEETEDEGEVDTSSSKKRASKSRSRTRKTSKS